MNHALADEGTQRTCSLPNRTLMLLPRQASAAELLAALQTLQQADGLPLAIEVLCQGDADLVRGVGAHWMAQGWRPGMPRVRLWHVAVVDRANAFNQAVHRLWTGQGAALLTDGRAALDAARLQALFAAVEPAAPAVEPQRPAARTPPVLAATALPADARRRQRLLSQGDLCGDGLALSASALTSLRRRRVRLPLGHADVDGLLAQLLGFGLDPRHHDWDLSRRVAVCSAPGEPAGAVPQRQRALRHLRDPLGALERLDQRLQRQLAEPAVQAHGHLERRLPEHLPRTSRELVDQWAARYPQACQALLRGQPLLRLAWARLRRPRNWSPAAIEPRLLLDSAHRHRDAAAAAPQPVHHLRTAGVA